MADQHPNSSLIQPLHSVVEVKSEPVRVGQPNRCGFFNKICIPNLKLICGVFAGFAALITPLVITLKTDCMSALAIYEKDNNCHSSVGNVAAIILGIETILGCGVCFVGGCRNRNG